MSIERELLKRFMIELTTEADVVSLFNDIKECLAQPEQTEQEPVAWITEWVQRYRHNDTPIMDRAVSFTKGDAPAVPNPNYIPLYTAPPKQFEQNKAEAVMPNGIRVSNVYDAYEEGRKSVMSEQEPDSYTADVAAKKLFRVLGWTNKGEEK